MKIDIKGYKMKELEKKIYYPALRGDQFKFFLKQHGYKQVRFSCHLSKHPSYVNKKLSEGGREKRKKPNLVPGFFVRKLIREIGEEKFFITMAHWNLEHGPRDQIKFLDDCNDELEPLMVL